MKSELFRSKNGSFINTHLVVGYLTQPDLLTHDFSVTAVWLGQWVTLCMGYHCTKPFFFFRKVTSRLVMDADGGESSSSSPDETKRRLLLLSPSPSNHVKTTAQIKSDMARSKAWGQLLVQGQ